TPGGRLRPRHGRAGRGPERPCSGAPTCTTVVPAQRRPRRRGAACHPRGRRQVRAGQIIGERYRLEERLGAGGHGEVWRAADLRLHERPVALKRTRHDGDEGGAERVRREARSLSRISHPHVVAVHDVVDDAGEVWVVMEYVAGRTLAETRSLSPAAAARYGAQLAGG